MCVFDLNTLLCMPEFVVYIPNRWFICSLLIIIPSALFYLYVLV